MKMFTFTRLLSVAMAGVLCGGVLVPLALANHKPLLAAGLVVVWIIYAVANVLAWRKLRHTL